MSKSSIENGWRKCVCCGKDYHVNSLHQRYCSARCWERAYRNGVRILAEPPKWQAVQEVVDVLKGAEVPLSRDQIAQGMELMHGVKYNVAAIAVIIHYARRQGYAIDSFNGGVNGRLGLYAMTVPTC